MTNDKNDTNSQYSYTPIEQGWLFSIIAVGNLVGTLILPYLLVKFSMRTILTGYGLISGIATLLTPLSAYISYVALLIMRFLQGFAMSMCFTALGSITSQWASLKESGFFLATLSIHF
uniref:Major facilitator superfamily (MFS) profile domain-containing protein n=1 Tax=Acrobeloides nanus TaxID=290746 RepID=A0A914DYQ9_9BILA